MSLPPSSSLHILFISKLSKWLIKIIYLRCDVRVKIVIRDPLADLLLVVLLVVLLPDQPCKDIWGACLLLSFVSHFFLSLGVLGNKHHTKKVTKFWNIHFHVP
jgi:hypothetical protein